MTHKLKTPPLLSMTRCMAFSTMLILTGCASSPGDNDPGKRPDWVDGNSSHYPREQYIIGRGQADRLSRAQDIARANIAKTFQVNIHERSTDTQQIKQTSDEQGTRSSRDARIRRHIITETDQIIDGIEIADVWQNPDTGQYYTLAILSRHQASTRLRQDIEQLDKATMKSIAASRASDDALTQAGFAAQALMAQQQRAAYQKMASIIDLSGRGVTPRWQLAQLESDLDSLLGRIHIQAVSLTADKTGQALTSVLTGALTVAGITPGDENNSDYILTGQLELTDLGLRDGWHWQRASVQIELTDKTGGQLRGNQSWNKLKAAGLDSSIARQRLLKQVEETLKNDLRQTLIDMAMP